MYSHISEQTRAEVNTFEQEITLPNGKTFNHRETIKMISYHALGEFYKNDDSNDIFYPLGQKRAPHFAKKLDTDSKDYEVTDEGNNNVAASWVANIKLRTWFRKSGFALSLNDLSEHCADYGSTLMKLTPCGDEDELLFCNLLNIWFDPSVANIVDSPIIELHRMSEDKIRGMKGWKDVDKALEVAELADNNETSKSTLPTDIVKEYKIWERTGWFQRTGMNGVMVDKEPKYLHVIFCGYGESEVILHEEELKIEECPYFDFHISKYADRWLRIGVYERLFGLQRLVNEIVNYDKEAQAISSLILLKSRDKNLIGRSVLEEAFSGMILDNDDLQQVAVDNRAVSEFLNKLMRYEMKADELCMTPDVITGGEMPSSATFRGQALQTNVANDAFENARDRIGFKMADFILEKKLPSLMKKWNSEDVLEISAADENAKIFDYYARKHIMSEFVKEQWAKGYTPTLDEIQEFQARMEEELKMGKRKQGLKDLFKGYKYGLRLNPTGENVNKEQRNGVYSGALAMAQNYPTFFQQLMKRYLGDNGINGIDIPIEELQQAQQSAMIPDPQSRMSERVGEGQTEQPAPMVDKLAALING